MLYDAYVLYLVHFVTSILCAATFSNSYIKWRLRYVMLRFVAVPYRVANTLAERRNFGNILNAEIKYKYKRQMKYLNL